MTMTLVHPVHPVRLEQQDRSKSSLSVIADPGVRSQHHQTNNCQANKVIFYLPQSF